MYVYTHIARTMCVCVYVFITDIWIFDLDKFHNPFATSLTILELRSIAIKFSNSATHINHSKKNALVNKHKQIHITSLSWVKFQVFVPLGIHFQRKITGGTHAPVTEVLLPFE